MKRAILSAVLFAAITTCYSQPINRLIVQTDRDFSDTSLVAGTMPPQMLSEIMDVVGLRQNFELKEAKVLNIEASISHGRRYILYNPEFISWITRVTGTKWAAMALLAHEVGHHLNGHTIQKGGSKPELELEADEFAGFVLHRLGATLAESQQVMNYIAKPEISATHPGRASRLLAIENGWDRASENATNLAARTPAN